MPILKKRLTNALFVYYNKLLYYGKYAPKYGFIVPQPAEKSKRNFWKRVGERLLKSDRRLRITTVICRPARKRGE